MILVQNFHLQVEAWEKMELMHIDNKNKDIVNLVEGPARGLGDTKLTAEAKYRINFIQSGKSLHCNGSNSFLFVNVTKIYQFKAKDSKIKYYTLFLGNYN